MKVLNTVCLFLLYLQNINSLIQPSSFLQKHPIIAANAINTLTKKLPMLDQLVVF